MLGDYRNVWFYLVVIGIFSLNTPNNNFGMWLNSFMGARGPQQTQKVCHFDTWLHSYVRRRGFSPQCIMDDIPFSMWFEPCFDQCWGLTLLDHYHSFDPVLWMFKYKVAMISFCLESFFGLHPDKMQPCWFHLHHWQRYIYDEEGTNLTLQAAACCITESLNKLARDGVVIRDRIGEEAWWWKQSWNCWGPTYFIFFNILLRPWLGL